MMESHFVKMIGLFTLVIVLFLQSSIHFALSDELNPGLYSAKSDPFGISFSTWTEKWWQWYIKIPDRVHPFGDSTGKYCGTNQGGPVWYLAGAKGKVVRSCEIPSDKAILFPILNTEYSYLEVPTAKTEQDLRSMAISGNAHATIKASIDGYEIKLKDKDIDRYRVASGLFNVTFPPYPELNVFGFKLKPGQDPNSQAVSDGWFIMLEPLKPGNHIIKWGASQPPSTESPETSMDVTYNLMIR